MSITRETRRESYEKLDNATLYKHILKLLGTGGEYTAHEIAAILYAKKCIQYPMRQAVAPRLTELVAEGLIEVTGKAYDKETGRKVACYGLVAK